MDSKSNKVSILPVEEPEAVFVPSVDVDEVCMTSDVSTTGFSVCKCNTVLASRHGAIGRRQSTLYFTAVRNVQHKNKER